MKRFGSILTFITSGAFVSLVIYAIMASLFASQTGQSSEAQGNSGELLGYMTPLVYGSIGTLAVSEILLCFTCLFAFIGICTRKGGIAATSRCALIGFIFSAISLITVLVGTLVTEDVTALWHYVIELVQPESIDKESLYKALIIAHATFAGYNLIVFLFGLISNPNLSKEGSKKGKKAQVVKKTYSVDPSEREVYSEEDRLNMAAYGSLVSGATPRTTTRSGYYTVNNYSGSSYSYGKKQKHKKGRCTDAELFNRFNKVLVSNGYTDSLGGRGGFPF